MPQSEVFLKGFHSPSHSTNTVLLNQFITEYAIGNHDSVTAAAGILTYVPRLSGKLPLMSYWAFSDVFEEHGIEAVPFHNEWGLVNIYGNPKPAFRAFELLHEAGDLAAPVSLVGSASGAASKGLYASKMMDAENQTSITVFVTIEENTMKTAQQVKAFVTAYNKSDDCGNDLQPMAVLATVKFCGVGGLGSSAALPKVARLRRIDNAHGNTRGYWATNLSSTVYPTDAEIAQMEEASMLEDEIVALTADAACVVAAFEMPAVAVAVVDFELSL